MKDLKILSKDSFPDDDSNGLLSRGTLYDQGRELAAKNARLNRTMQDDNKAYQLYERA